MISCKGTIILFKVTKVVAKNLRKGTYFFVSLQPFFVIIYNQILQAYERRCEYGRSEGGGAS